MNKYCCMVKTSLKQNNIYKMSCVVEIFSSILSIVMLKALWEMLYSDSAELADYMLNYNILSTILGVIFVFNSPNKLANSIRNGNIGLDVLRPWNLFIGYLCEDIGGIIHQMLTRALPIYLIASFLYRFYFPTIVSSALIICSIPFSICILYLTRICVSLLCFWMLEAWSLQFLLDTLILILSGKMIPSWIFPKSVEKIFYFFPYIWTIQKPVELCLLNCQDEKEIIFMFTIQSLWMLFLVLTVWTLWKKAYKKIVVQGG